METLEELKQRVPGEKQLAARLQMASARLKAAQPERIWGIVAANEAGLSIRQIAVATGLSPSRIHQLLQALNLGKSLCGSVKSIKLLCQPSPVPLSLSQPHQRLTHRRGGSSAKSALTGWSDSLAEKKWWSTCAQTQTAKLSW